MERIILLLLIVSCTYLLFRAYSRYNRHETFSFMTSLPAMSLGLRLCMGRKGGTGEGGWVDPKGTKKIGHVWARL